MNPYEKWLGVFSAGPSPNYFELLGVSRSEDDNEIITESAKLQLGKLQKYRNGEHAAVCQKLIERIRRAHQVLTHPSARSKYEFRLDQQEPPILAEIVEPAEFGEVVELAEIVEDIADPRQYYTTNVAAPDKKQTSKLPMIVIAAALTAFLIVGVSTWLLYNLFNNETTNVAAVIEEPAPVINSNSRSNRQSQTETGVSREAPAADPKLPLEPKQPGRETLAWSETLKRVAADLEEVPPREREWIRYFSFDNLVSEVSETELSNRKIALSKLVNSLSWNAEIATLEPIKGQGSLLRIDLRDLKWDAGKWEMILLDYPYGYIGNSEAGSTIRDLSVCECAIVRADWFIAAASRAPLYHDLLEIPSRISDLEQRLQIDSMANIRDARVQRIGTTESSLTSTNRVIEKHDSAFGTYWKTYDFAKIDPLVNSNRQQTLNNDLLKTPLGPRGVTSGNAFEHHSQQIIFTLPNGLLGFAQSDANGTRINKSDSEIVPDMKMLDHAALTGVSCFDCHRQGLIAAKDQVRQHFAEHENADTRAAINDLYVTEAEGIFQGPNSSFQKVIADHGFATSPNQTEPIRAAVDHYNESVSLKLAAAELGVPPLKLKRTIDGLLISEMPPGLEILNRTSELDRFTFSLNYRFLVEKMKLGRALQATLSRKADRRLSSRIEAYEKSRSPNFDRRHAEAEKLFFEGRRLRSADNLEEAIENFEAAFELAPDKHSRKRALRTLAELHEEQKNFEGLARAFSRLILESETRREMQKTHNQFYKSVFRAIVADEEAHSYARHKIESMLREPDDSSFIMWPDLEPPSEVVRPMAEVFNAQLEKTPEHLGTLMVLDTFFKKFLSDPHAHKEILEKLRQSDPKHSSPASTAMARVLSETGEHQKAAQMYEQLNRDKDSPSSYDFYCEGMAWTKAKRKEKAIPVLEKAEALLSKEDPTSIFLVKIGEAWAQFDEHQRAVKTYTNLLGEKSSTMPLKKIQKNLELSLAKSGMSAKVIASNPLLDPKRKFRETAERFDNREESIDLIRNGNYLMAAQNWFKGDRPEKALASATAAWEGIRKNLKNRNISHECKQLAKLFLQLDQKQLAYDAYVFALKHERYLSSISQLQKTVAQLGEDPAVRKSDESEEILAPDFKYRSIARQTESKKANTEAIRAKNLFDAASSWAKAGDSAEVLRCTREGVEILDRLSVPTSDGKTSEEVARLYHAVIELNSKLTTQLAAEDSRLGPDVQAYSQNELAQLIKLADRKLAGLDEATKRRVDPMNKFRDDARRLESEAEGFIKRKQFGQALRLYGFAAQNWERTGDKKEQHAVVMKARDVVDQLSKTGSAHAFEYSSLGAQLLKVGEPALARKYYQLAVESDRVPRQKERYKKIIEDIDAKSKL